MELLKSLNYLLNNYPVDVKIEFENSSLIYKGSPINTEVSVSLLNNFKELISCKIELKINANHSFYGPDEREVYFENKENTIIITTSATEKTIVPIIINTTGSFSISVSNIFKE
jgi:hypothetical protein